MPGLQERSGRGPDLLLSAKGRGQAFLIPEDGQVFQAQKRGGISAAPFCRTGL